MRKVSSVRVLEDYRLELVFADGVRGIVSLKEVDMPADARTLLVGLHHHRHGAPASRAGTVAHFDAGPETCMLHLADRSRSITRQWEEWT
jgi:hypothetical protein